MLLPCRCTLADVVCFLPILWVFKGYICTCQLSVSVRECVLGVSGCASGGVRTSLRQRYLRVYHSPS